MTGWFGGWGWGIRQRLIDTTSTTAEKTQAKQRIENPLEPIQAHLYDPQVRKLGKRLSMNADSRQVIQRQNKV